MITVKSIGKRRQNKNDHRKIDLAATEATEPLKYVVGANITGKEHGNGNLFLHGGMEIQGDVNVDGDLILYKDMFSFLDKLLGWLFWEPSYQKITSADPNKNPSLYLDGTVYRFDRKNVSPKNYQNHINNAPTGNEYTCIENDIKNYLVDAANLEIRNEKEKPQKIDLNIEETINAAYKYINSLTSYEIEAREGEDFPNVSLLHLENSKVVPVNWYRHYILWPLIWEKRYYKKEDEIRKLVFQFNGDYHFKFFESLGNVWIYGQDTKFAIGDVQTQGNQRKRLLI